MRNIKSPNVTLICGKPRNGKTAHLLNVTPTNEKRFVLVTDKSVRKFKDQYEYALSDQDVIVGSENVFSDLPDAVQGASVIFTHLGATSQQIPFDFRHLLHIVNFAAERNCFVAGEMLDASGEDAVVPKALVDLSSVVEEPVQEVEFDPSRKGYQITFPASAFLDKFDPRSDLN